VVAMGFGKPISLKEVSQTLASTLSDTDCERKTDACSKRQRHRRLLSAKSIDDYRLCGKKAGIVAQRRHHSLLGRFSPARPAEQELEAL
jgi:hypothetical protein